MDVEIRRTKPNELREVAGAVRVALLDGRPDDDAWTTAEQRWSTLTSFSAWEAGRCVGHVASFDIETYVPGGGHLTTAAVSSAGVLPTHARRGIFTRLMEELTDDAVSRGLPAMSLRASEATIYGRYGYGVAGTAVSATIETARTRPFRGAAAGTFELVDPADVMTTVQSLYEASIESPSPTRPGVITRPQWLWDRYFENAVTGTTSESVVVHRSPTGELDGYAHYEVTWSDDIFSPDHGSGKVHEIWASSPSVEIALWSYLCDIDLVRRFTVEELASDSVLFTAAADARSVKVATRWDEQWLRLLDVPAAFAARSWADAADVVIEIADARFPSNDGRWRVGSGRAEPTGDAPDLTTDVAGISAAYLGSTSWWELVATGSAVASDPSATARADAVFGHRPLAFSGTFF